MRILVTGHRGFLGQHFWQALSDEHDLIGVDIEGGGYDVRRISEWWGEGPDLDLVIHCAANVGGRATIDGNPLWVARNLAIDQALFEWALDARPGRILYLSSSAVYNTNLQGPAGAVDLQEVYCQIGAPLMGIPDQTYGWAKLTGELLAQHVAAEGVPVSIVRPFSGYSESQSLDYPFPSLAARAVAHEDPFDVWGSGEQCRDWIHVDDLIAGALTVVDEGIDEPVNLGTGRATSFNDLAFMFMEAAGYHAEIHPLLDKPAGVAYRVADTSFLDAVYVPKVSLEEGVDRAVKAAS